MKSDTGTNHKAPGAALDTAALHACNQALTEFARLIDTGTHNPWQGPLHTGVDLGTANIVLAVTDEQGRPVAGASHPSSVVRDGIVVDYMGAVQAVRQLKSRLETLLGQPLDRAACAIPPGVHEGSVKAIGNVVQAADLTLTNVVDEPTAAAAVMDVRSGAVVDVGGGTTGISILKDGQVVFTTDEPTGGTHMTLVLAGFENCSIPEAERMKTDPARERDVFPVIRPVVDKMATIVQRAIAGRDVEAIYVVGGACCFSGFAAVFEKLIGIPVYKPAAPLLVTPLGIARSCG